ncbi:MAG: oxidoreductase-like domain-containing protein [Panacagrimonas sp.]
MTEPSTRPVQDEVPLPPRPERPDCCGGGCAVCVLDGYQEEVDRWEQQVAALHNGASDKAV